MLNQLNALIGRGLSAYHISQVLRLRGRRVYCFGSYYTVKCGGHIYSFAETDRGVVARLVG
jgi:hypothetical protein